MRVQAVNLLSGFKDYRTATTGEEVVSLVFGGKPGLADDWIDDADVAANVMRDPERMIGFMSLNHRFSLPRDHVENLIFRDALGVLALPNPRQAVATEAKAD